MTADVPFRLGFLGAVGTVTGSRYLLEVAGKRLLAAHGRRDRITSYDATQAYVERAREVAAEAELRDMGPIGHYMLRRVSAWNELAARGALDML